jgi:hypothetical protein
MIWQPKRWWRPLFVYARRIDRNFSERYSGPRRVPIPWDKDHRRPEFDTIMISQWYRDALGIKTTSKDNQTDRYKLGLRPVPRIVGWYGWLRAGCQCPDPVVRIGTRLGVLGAWLGLLGLGDPVQRACDVAKWCRPTYQALMASFGVAEDQVDEFRSLVTVVVLLAVGIVLWFSCLGRPRPTVTNAGR